jgi:hypothetical protein
MVESGYKFHLVPYIMKWPAKTIPFFWIEACFREVGLDWNDYTETDRRYASPYRRFVSDPAKLLSLGWKPECTFSGLAAMMIPEAARRCEVSEPKADAP